ncbi:hypothetical protein ABT390_22720 [Streptomyces aurantiacus]|uniref:Uncharacterized protein n=1 Tax=Streptomyces aurantiacus JA 4570 TaxID=1286094 RepID=S3ZSY5_9ACTN|nr:hypothetical protein [Streptomyces aurantiacus]EPH41515.1 hypothetical protein STRAU_5424 [Streptomyces aurantiacus JA 4570]
MRGVEGTAFVAEHVERADDPKAALAGIRFLGADAFAPHLLADAVFHPDDAAAVTQSFAVFPPPVRTPDPPPAGPAEPWVAAWRDWATAALLARLAGTAGLLAPRPSGAPVLTDRADSAAADADSGSEGFPETGASGASDTDWQHWSVRMGQLSPLALPALDGPVHAAARAAPLALARGATRAVLRRDFPTAARITRWLALLHAEGVRLPLDPVPLVEHLRLHGGGPRLALDVAIARCLLGPEAP